MRAPFFVCARGPRVRKSHVVDASATIVFFTIVAAISEAFIAGMDAYQGLTARLIMIATGRPYGLWRDRVLTRFRPKIWTTNVMCDIAAFIPFQVPVYVATLVVAGATMAEIGTAVSASAVFMILLSQPFGLYLDAFRHWAGTAIKPGANPP